MNTEQGMKFYNGMTNIRPEIIEEAQCAPACKKKLRWVRWIAAAACLCLIVGTAAALTTTEFGTRLIGLFTLGEASDESGYQLGIGIERISEKELTGDIQEVSDIIVQQFEKYKPYSSLYPGSWRRSFPTSDEAQEFVGYEGLKALDWELEETEVEIRVLGDRKGNIQTVALESRYWENDIRLQAVSRLYTEHYDGELTAGVHTTEYVEFTESFYTTGSGKTCHMISGTPMESGYRCLDGYLVDGGVLYQLHIAYFERDGQDAERLLRQWADLF